MAFGSFKSFGGGGRGGVVGQQPGGLSAMFLGLGEGLGEWAKSRAASELEEKRGAREDARALAERASRENIERWRNTAEAEREATRQTGETERSDKSNLLRVQEAALNYNREIAQMEQTGRFQAGELRIRGAEAANQAAATASLTTEREAMAKDREESAKLRAKQQDSLDAAAKRGDAKEMISVLDSQVNPYKIAVDNARKEYENLTAGGRADASDPLQKAAKDKLEAATSAYSGVVDTQKEIRDKITSNLGYGPKPPDPFETLSPDRRAWADRQAQATPGKSREEIAKAAQDPSLTPDMIKKAVTTPTPAPAAADAAPAPPPLLAKPAPAAPAPAPAAPGATSTSFVSPTGVADPNAPPTPTAMDPNAAQVASTTSPPPDAAIAPSGTAIAAPDAAAAPPDDQTSKWEQTAQELPQSPDGQGVLATLSRLADAKQGPVADKMRRAAEIQLDNQYPDQDNGGFIDYFLDQNSQQQVA
jgi:hypothetical protein